MLICINASLCSDNRLTRNISNQSWLNVPWKSNRNISAPWGVQLSPFALCRSRRGGEGVRPALPDWFQSHQQDWKIREGDNNNKKCERERERERKKFSFPSLFLSGFFCLFKSIIIIITQVGTRPIDGPFPKWEPREQPTGNCIHYQWRRERERRRRRGRKKRERVPQNETSHKKKNLNWKIEINSC